MRMTDVLVRIERTDGSTQVARLTQSMPVLVVDASPGRWQVARVYSVLGVEHILTGVDHLLFVLALLIITRGSWKLVKTVTAFTLSHSVTLTAATLGFVHGNFGGLSSSPHHQVVILAAPFWQTAHCDLRRFHQQETHQRISLFGDVPQSPPIPAGFF